MVGGWGFFDCEEDASGFEGHGAGRKGRGLVTDCQRAGHSEDSSIGKGGK